MSNYCTCHIDESECIYCNYELHRVNEISRKQMIETGGNEFIKVRDIQFLLNTICGMSEKIAEKQGEIYSLKETLEEITEDRNTWRSNSLDWEGEEEENE